MPGCVGTVEGADGQRAFLKAVSPAEYPESADRITQEIAVLRALAGAPHVPRILETFDVAGWVGFVEEFVPGRSPKLYEERDFGVVNDALEELSPYLTPPPPVVESRTMSAILEKWLGTWERVIERPDYLEVPRRVVAIGLSHEAEMYELRYLMDGTFLCHWDLSPGNIVVGGRSEVCFVDWASTKVGPSWSDPYFLILNSVEGASFDRRAEQFGARLPLNFKQLNAMLVLQSISWWVLARDGSAKGGGLPGLRQNRLDRAKRVAMGLERRVSTAG